METRSPQPHRSRIRSFRFLAPCLTLLLGGLCWAQPLLALGTWVVESQPAAQDLNKINFVDDKRGWIIGDAGTILATIDGGENWIAQTSPTDFDLIDIDMLDENLGWALAQRYVDPTGFETKLLRTVNGGADWTIQGTFSEALMALAFTSPTVGFLGGEEGKLIRTADGGQTWDDALVIEPETARWPILDFNFYSPTFGIATGGRYDAIGLVWRTQDGGNTWTHERVAGEPIFATHFFDEQDAVSVGGDLDWGSGVITSSSGATHWDYKFLGIWGQASAVSFRTPVEGWSPLGFSAAVMYTLDAGHNWTSIPTPDNLAMNDVVFLNPNKGFMVGAEGTVLAYAASPTGIDAPGLASSGQSLYLENSPNPSRKGFQVAFRIAERTHVSLKVYDPTGREVAKYLGEELAPGSYDRTFESGDLPSGVYHYKLRAGNQIETMKVVLVK